MACLRLDRSNAELLAFVADVTQRFSAAIIGVRVTRDLLLQADRCALVSH
jgi:hypothetical protein